MHDYFTQLYTVINFARILSLPQPEKPQPKTNPEPAPNKVPPPTQGKHLRFDGSEYVDENNRAEF
jgi:hypothetical protein